MSNISISLIELLIKGIPEGLLDVLAIYILTKTPFDKKKYILISSIFIVTTYLIRWLPINLGVNTMISLLVLVVIFLCTTKIDLTKLIKSIISMAIILITCEEINILLLIAIFGKNSAQELLSSSIGKSLYGSPSTVFFAIVIFIIYFVIKKKAKNTNTDNTQIE